MDEQPNQSPQPVKRDQILPTLTFYDALRELANGKRISKLEWGDNQIFGALRNNEVQIHLADGQFKQWTINDGDLFGTDWVVLED